MGITFSRLRSHLPIFSGNTNCSDSIIGEEFWRIFGKHGEIVFLSLPTFTFIIDIEIIVQHSRKRKKLVCQKIYHFRKGSQILENYFLKGSFPFSFRPKRFLILLVYENTYMVFIYPCVKVCSFQMTWP